MSPIGHSDELKHERLNRQGRIIHVSQRLAGSCIARRTSTEPFAPLFEISSLVCVDKGVNNTVQDPKEHQSTGQVQDIRNQSYGEKKYNESS